MPNCTETSTFGGEHGWTGQADEEWMREHIQPMVEQARRQPWPAWSRREATRAASAAEHVAAGRYTDALDPHAADA